MENCRRSRQVTVMPPIPLPPAPVRAAPHPFAPPGAPLPSPSCKAPMAAVTVPQRNDFHNGQIVATLNELRRVGVERLSLERALAPGESPATSPDSSPGSTEGDLAAAPLTQTTTSRESVKVLADLVDRELRQCGGRNGRGRLAAVHPRLFPLLDAAMKSLGALRNAKRREDELFRRLRVVGQAPPAKPAVIAAATEVSDALGELTESLWRISSFLASLGG